MKIKKISVNNFKALDEIEISPKMVNVIVGRNNTGKSSFLQSIIFDFRPTELDEILRDNPSAIINYLSDNGSVKIIMKENRNESAQEIRFTRSSRETVFENLRADVISFFKRVRGKTFIISARIKVRYSQHTESVHPIMNTSCNLRSFDLFPVHHVSQSASLFFIHNAILHF